MASVTCDNCGRGYPDVGIPYRCGQCMGLYDFSSWPEFTLDQIDVTQLGIWRYKSFLGLPMDSPSVYLGEGNTPLIWGNVSGQLVGFKCEYQNPTGSFKDRGSAALVSFLLSRGCESAIEDSSGNAGASFAAYAAKAGINAKIFIPDSASGPKRRQIEQYGAELVKILGPRSNASEAVRRFADQGTIYASHVYLPFNLPGYATAAYEIFEQLGDAPGTVVVPAGHGGLVLGLGRGFQALKKAGLINNMPIILAVQAEACAPMWALMKYGPVGLGMVSEGETVAEGIRVRYPLRGDSVLRFLEENKGTIVAVDDEQIIRGRDHLARQGFYVEDTSGVIWNAIEQVKGKVVEPIIAILTGNGLKSNT